MTDLKDSRWRSDPALYSARCERLRRRKEERMDRVVRKLFTCAVVFFAWVVSVALVLVWW